MEEERYNKALERNIAELSNAILKRSALIGLHNAKSSHALDFFRIASHALYNDVLSHLMKVFDHHTDTASFWQLVKSDEKTVYEIAEEHSIDMGRMKSLSQRVKNIRNKTHFHIDKHAVVNPKEIWQQTDLKGDDLKYLLESGFLILSNAYKKRTGEIRSMPDYDGSDVPDIIRSYKKCFPKVPICIEDVSLSNIERLQA